MSDMDTSRSIDSDESSISAPVARPRKPRRLSQYRREQLAFQEREPPPIEQTLRELETLATKRYETRARTKNAIRNATLALRDALETLESFSAHESLVAKSTVKHLHRKIRERVALDMKPKRQRRKVDE
jgi:hypothetical protein